MCKWTVFLFVLISPVLLFSQGTIRGRVVNGTTGEPIPGSSVFINGSSIGTLSDSHGQFELSNIPRGRYELVISSIGYETNVFSFTSDQLPLQLKIEMDIKIKELENVVVEPSVEEGWDKWGQTFISSFIGTAPNAKNCRIRNTGDIRFRFYKKSNRVIAYSDKPLIIENRSLGYRIQFQLEDFEANFANGSVMYTGYPFFEDMAKRNLPRKWRLAREKAYNGSMKHFMRALYLDSLVEYGFELRRMVRSSNLEKQRVSGIFRDSMAAIRKRTGTSAPGSIFRINNITSNKDSSDYYQRVMRQKDYVDNYSTYLLKADSVSVKTDSYRVLFFNDFLSIIYRHELEDPEFFGFLQPGRKPGYQRSLVWLPSQQPVSIDINGNYYPPQEIFAMDYWGWIEKIADMLPSDYSTE